MWRGIAGVVLGYVAMFVVVFVTFTAVYLLMGTEGVFESGSYEVSGLWILASFVLGLIAAVLGGLVCALISRGGKAPFVLAAIVLLLGLLMAVPVLMSDNPDQGARNGDVDNLEAMQQARQPAWVALANPFLGAAGVLLGARLRRATGEEEPA